MTEHNKERLDSVQIANVRSDIARHIEERYVISGSILEGEIKPPIPLIDPSPESTIEAPDQTGKIISITSASSANASIIGHRIQTERLKKKAA